MDHEPIETALLQVPGVAALHDLHIWAITSGVPSLAAHLVLKHGADVAVVQAAATGMLDERFEFEHVILQTERTYCRDGRDHHGLH